jgi:hypothetical protein
MREPVGVSLRFEAGWEQISWSLLPWRQWKEPLLPLCRWPLLSKSVLIAAWLHLSDLPAFSPEFYRWEVSVLA